MTEAGKLHNINRTFRILSALGIIFIVAGHADFQIFDLGGLFPYYSFHVELFVFISGYFYREESEEKILTYLRHKAARLLVPYFVWNLFYGLLAAALRGGGFCIGEAVSLRTLFIDPFLGGHQFGYNFPAWFVPALFVVEAVNVCMRRVLSFCAAGAAGLCRGFAKRAPKLSEGDVSVRGGLAWMDWLFMAGTLTVGILTVWLAIGGHVWGYYKFPGRILFMLPVFEFGRLYRKKLEALDRLPNGIYFVILILIQLTVELNCAGLAYSTVWCSGFANGPFIPYLTACTGIAFWLRIARILTPLYNENGLMARLGRETYAIMLHHILSFMLVKGAFGLIARWTPYFADFDWPAFHSDVNYIYLIQGSHATKWIYLAAGLLLPLLLTRRKGNSGPRLFPARDRRLFRDKALKEGK